MKLLLLAIPTLFCIHTAAAQSVPDIKFKEGLWEEATTSTMRSTVLPTGTPSTFTTSRCHSHAYDDREMRRGLSGQQECKYANTSQTDTGWEMEGVCSTPGMPPGMTISMKLVGTSIDEDHFNLTMDAVYPANMPGGLTGTSSSVVMTYKGPCPANMRPGDLSETLPNGKSMILPVHEPQAANLPARGIHQIGGAQGRSSMTLAQNSSPGLNQRTTPTHASSGPPITNADVIALASAGLDDAVILAKIQAASGSRFDISIEGLKALKAGGVSGPVIKTIVSTASAAEAEAAANSEDPNVMHQPGVYALISGRDGQVHLLQLEHTHAAGENMSGNTLAMSYFHTKKHTRESLNNPTSPVKIDDRNPTFYIYIPPDTQSFGGSDLSARDFELLKLRVKSKTREVETASTSLTGMGSSGIEDKARQPTTAQKVKPGIYMVKVTTPLKPGEYAFQHELEGVFYDFTITESR